MYLIVLVLLFAWETAGKTFDASGGYLEVGGESSRITIIGLKFATVRFTDTTTGVITSGDVTGCTIKIDAQIKGDVVIGDATFAAVNVTLLVGAIESRTASIVINRPAGGLLMQFTGTNFAQDSGRNGVFFQGPCVTPVRLAMAMVGTTITRSSIHVGNCNFTDSQLYVKGGKMTSGQIGVIASTWTRSLLVLEDATITGSANVNEDTHGTGSAPFKLFSARFVDSQIVLRRLTIAVDSPVMYGLAFHSSSFANTSITVQNCQVTISRHVSRQRAVNLVDVVFTAKSGVAVVSSALTTLDSITYAFAFNVEGASSWSQSSLVLQNCTVNHVAAGELPVRAVNIEGARFNDSVIAIMDTSITGNCVMAPGTGVYLGTTTLTRSVLQIVRSTLVLYGVYFFDERWLTGLQLRDCPTDQSIVAVIGTSIDVSTSVSKAIAVSVVGASTVKVNSTTFTFDGSNFTAKATGISASAKVIEIATFTAKGVCSFYFRKLRFTVSATSSSLLELAPNGAVDTVVVHANIFAVNAVNVPPQSVFGSSGTMPTFNAVLIQENVIPCDQQPATNRKCSSPLASFVISGMGYIGVSCNKLRTAPTASYQESKTLTSPALSLGSLLAVSINFANGVCDVCPERVCGLGIGLVALADPLQRGTCNKACLCDASQTQPLDWPRCIEPPATQPPAPITEAPTEAPSEPLSEPPTEPPSDPTTLPFSTAEATTDAPTNPPTTVPSDAPTTDPPTDTPTDAPTAATDSPNDPPTDAPTPAPTEAPTPAPPQTPAPPSVTKVLSQSRSMTLSHTQTPPPTKTRTKSPSTSRSRTVTPPPTMTPTRSGTPSRSGTRTRHPTTTASVGVSTTTTLAPSRSESPTPSLQQSASPTVSLFPTPFLQPMPSVVNQEAFASSTSASRRLVLVVMGTTVDLSWLDSLSSNNSGAAAAPTDRRSAARGASLVSLHAGSAQSPTGFVKNSASIAMHSNFVVSVNATHIDIELGAAASYYSQTDESIDISFPAAMFKGKTVPVSPATVTLAKPNRAGVSVAVKEAAEAVAATSAGLSSATSMNGAAAAQAARSNLLLSLKECEFNVDDEPSWMEFPLGITFDDSPYRYHITAAVLNPALLAGFALLHAVVSLGLQKCLERWRARRGVARGSARWWMRAAFGEWFFPSAQFLLVMFFIQPSVTFATRAAINGNGLDDGAILMARRGIRDVAGVGGADRSRRCEIYGALRSRVDARREDEGHHRRWARPCVLLRRWWVGGCSVR
jgi:hypothetical protein